MELLLCDLDLYIINDFTFKYTQRVDIHLNPHNAAQRSILFFAF